MEYYVLAAVILGVLVVGGFTLILRTRKMVVQEQTVPEDELAEFHRMHEEGRISEEEYKRLKHLVASRTVGKVEDEPETPETGTDPDAS